MVKKIFFSVILITLLLMPIAKLSAQSSITSEGTITFDKDSIPQWAKDIRRFDIVSFGIFPIAVMFTGFIYDNQFQITGSYYSDVLLISAGVSLTLAITDMVIVLVKRNKERRMLDRVPSGSYGIETIPYGEFEIDEQQESQDELPLQDAPSFEDAPHEEEI